MSHSPDTRPWLISAASVAFTLAAGCAVAIVLAVANLRLAATIAAGLAAAAAAVLSGNPRLFCLWGLMLTVPLNLSKYVTPYWNRGGGESAVRVEISDLFIALLAGFIAWDILSRRVSGLRVPRVTYFWLTIMVMGVITTFFGEWRRVAGFEVVRMFKVIVLFLVVCNELRRSGQILQGVAALSVSVLLQGLIGIAQYTKGATLGLGLLGETTERTMEILAETSLLGERVSRVSALLVHPNLFGVFLAALLPLCVAMFLVGRNGPIRLYYLGCAGIGVVALIATLSRSAWVSFAAAIMLLLAAILVHAPARRRALAPLLLLTACGAIVLVAFSDRIAARLFESKGVASYAREEFKEEARRLIAEKPIFGFGLNSYVDVVLPYSKYTRETYQWVPPVHNIYYLWWAETGLVGLSLNLAIIAGLMWTGLKNLRIRHTTLFAINAACLGAMAAFLVDGMFSFSLRVNPILRVFWVLAGILVALRYWRLAHESNEPELLATLPMSGDSSEAMGSRLAPISPRSGP